MDALQNFRKCINICVTALTLAHRWQLQYTEATMMLFSSFSHSFYFHKHYLVLELNKNGFISFSKALENLEEPNLSVLFHPHTWKNSFNFCAPAWLKAIA